MNKRKVSKNLIITFCIYAFLLVANIFVSRIVLASYGSEVNGLLSSVNQVFAYVALLEAGIGTATITAFYKPLADADKEGVSQIYAASIAYYRRVLKWYILCAVAVSFLWPFMLNTEIGYWTIFGVVFIQGVSNALTFYFVSTTTNYLLASGKNYINVYVHAAITILTYLAKAIISLLGGHILVITLSLLAINVLKCGFYWLYKKIKCREIVIQLPINKNLLKQRNSFLVHEISGCIFNATDLILISIFCDLKVASVYSVYSMVLNAISNIIGQVFNSTTYILGDAYSKKEQYYRIHDRFNTIYIAIVFCLYTITYLLLYPFVGIYTKGIEDVAYMDKYLPLLFVGVQLLSSCRIVDNMLIKIALHAKQTIGRTIAEATINLTLSLLLVNIIGIYGVLIGTIIALLYRTNDIIIYANRKLLGRSPLKAYKLYIINFLIFVLFLFINIFMPISANSYGELLIKAIGVCFVVATIYLIVNMIFFKKDIKGN